MQRCGGQTHHGCACCSQDEGMAVQRAKIDFRDLTWADFKGSPPGGGFPADTYSGMHPVPTKLKHLSSEGDTGVVCKLGKKVDSTIEAKLSIDSATFDEVKGYMWQEKSGANADYKKGLVGKTAKAVKACEQHFAKEAKRIAKAANKECAKQVKPCKEAFKAGEDSYTFTFDGEEVRVEEAKECSKGMLKDCRDAYIAVSEPATYSRKIGTGPTKACPAIPEDMEEMTAAEKAECAGTFKTEVDRLNKAESERLLAHEQLHFSISHRFAEDLRPVLVATAEPLAVDVTGCGTPAAVAAAKKAFAKLNAKATLNKDWNKAEKERSKTQKEYDKKTCHGLDQEKQLEWSGKF